jgi:predicted ATPase
MKIESIQIKNYKVFRDVTVKDLPAMSVFLGANGAGKTTFFDVFGFLSDALTNNVTAALNKRGGFREVRTRGAVGDIEFTIKYRTPQEDGGRGPIVTYEIAIGEEKGKAVIHKELLKYRRGQFGKPWHFLRFQNGIGYAIQNEDEYGSANASEEREEQQLDSADILAIKGLGQFQRFKAIASFRKLLEGWYVSNFQIDGARTITDTGVSTHLSKTGNNLAQVTKYIYDNYRDIFDVILEKMSQRIPGIERVEAVETADGRIILRFQDGSFKDPFIARYVSDGTIKMFAYLVLLHDPKPHPLLAIEEPENYLHPELQAELAEELRAYAKRGGQVFVSTHSPDFVNALELEELFWMQKDGGYSTVIRASDVREASALYEAGDKLGYLWRQHYFTGSGPKPAKG